MLAANLSWQAMKDSFHADDVPFGLLTSQLARHLLFDSGLLLHATVTVGASKNVTLVPVVMDSPFFELLLRSGSRGS
ncbi:hypothetical protein [Streptomyces sp. NPDC002758]